MDIFFCDVCCSRVTKSHLSRGHGVRSHDVIICGSCLEKGHGAELLQEAASAEKVGAAPRLAGSAVLDEPRDRAVTMKNLEDGSDSLDLELESDSEPVEEAAETIAAEKPQVDSEESQIDLGTLEASAEMTQPEVDDVLELDSPEDISVVDLDDVEDASGAQVIADESEDDLGVVDSEDVEDDSAVEDIADIADIEDVAAIDLADVDDEEDVNEAVDAASDEIDQSSNDAEQEKKSASISAEDVIDDLDDSGVHEIPDEDRLDDADNEVHTDSYSADELAAIKRIAEEEKEQAKKSSSARSSGRKKTASSRRSTAQSSRTSSRKKTSGRSGKSSRKVSTKSSTRRSAKKEIPMPMMISFVSIPILIIIMVIIAMNSGGEPVQQGYQYDDTVTGITTRSNDVRRQAQQAYESGDLAELRAAQSEIRDVMRMKDRVVQKMVDNNYSDNQIDKALRPYRKLMQLERAIRDRIEEVSSRQ